MIYERGNLQYPKQIFNVDLMSPFHSTDPVCVSWLKGKDIVCIAAGNKHTLALTRDCQVGNLFLVLKYSWPYRA